jgi:hypothetical protein
MIEVGNYTQNFKHLFTHNYVAQYVKCDVIGPEHQVTFSNLCDNFLMRVPLSNPGGNQGPILRLRFTTPAL